MNSIRIAALTLSLTAAAPAFAQTTPCAWQAENRNMMVEVEAVEPTGDWVEYTFFPGYTGDSYYRWDGPNFFTQPGNGIMTYTIEVHEEGRYELRIHNRHQHPDSTMENDCWVRMDGGPWIKLYSNGGGTVDQWNWKSRFEINGNHSDAGWDLTVGRHTFEVSGRSTGFMIDRLNFFMWNAPGNTNANWPGSPCGLGGPFCDSSNNSTGSPAEIEALGSISVSDNNLEMMVRPVPASQPGIVYYGENQIETPFGNGTRCVGGMTFRLPIRTSTMAGALRVPVDLTAPVFMGGQITAGSTWHFQGWFRDQEDSNGFQLSNGISINFLP